MENNVISGFLGFKGDPGLSAYDIAVAEGFVGTEQDWLANLGTSSIFDQYKKVVNITETTSKIDAPSEYTNTAFIEVYIDGLRLNKNQYAISTSSNSDETEKYEIVFTPAIESGKIVEIVTTQMTTNNLPIVSTIDEESTNDTAPGTKAVYEKLKAVLESITPLQTIVDTIYPVGSLYLSANNLDPSIIFGGKWERWGKGKAIVGVDENDTNFATAEKEYGEKTHKLTMNELPKLKGTANFRDVDLSGSDLLLNANGVFNRTITNWSGSHSAVQTVQKTTGYNYNQLNISIGNDQPHNNIQPSITCYIWKRVE